MVAILSVLVMLLAGWVSVGRAQSDHYVFGVPPYISAVDVDSIWGPVAAELQRKLGRRVLLQTARDFGSFESRVRERAYDILGIGTFLFKGLSGYVGIAMPTQDATIEVNALTERNLQSMEELRGGKIGIPEQGHLAAPYIQIVLRRAGMSAEDVDLVSIENATNCILLVVNRSIDACVTLPLVRESLAADRGIYVSAVLSDTIGPVGVLAAAERVPEADRLIIQGVFVNPDGPAGRAAIERLLLGPLGPFDPARLSRLNALLENGR